MVRFLADTRIAPTPKSSLLVISAGLPRTATSSLQAALEELGFDPCLHMAQIIPHASRQELLIAASREKDTATRQKQIHNLMDGYAAVCDMPAVFFLPDLMDMYPDAKVILSGRPSAEMWAQSCFHSLGFFFTRRFFWVGMLWKTDRLWYKLNMKILEWSLEKFEERDVFAASFYERYNESVREIARERGKEILEFKAEDGWAPLCEYLGKDIPAGDFPKVNEKTTFAVIKGILVMKGLVSWMALGGVVWLGWRYLPAFFV